MFKNILDRFGISIEEFTKLVDDNPSLRGFILGYIGEYKAKSALKSNKDVTNIYKPDDHNRNSKGDLYITYKGKNFRIEVKSLQTNSVKKLGKDIWNGQYQCDASDSRDISLPNGHTVHTTSLQVGEFDIVAIGLYQFGETWRFAFAKNELLPRVKPTKRNHFSEEDATYLIKGTIDIKFPLEKPYTDDIFSLMDSML